ncbi:MAG: ComEC/Rec2 family competence protein [Kiritimatiellae bacterium]|nr:ComEC/Rec2 family competence protein [Kiritimatiellia bacterium]
MKRPLVGMVLVFVAGTWLGLHLPDVADILLFLVLVLLSVSVMGRLTHSRLLPFLVYASLLFTGWLSVSFRGADTGDLLLQDLMGEQIEMVGVVTGDPSVRISANKRWGEWRFPVNVRRIRKPDTLWRSVKSQMDVCWRAYGVADDQIRYSSAGCRRNEKSPMYGQEWRFSGYADDYYRGKARGQNPVLRSGAGNSQYLSSCHGNRIAGACYSARRRAAALLSCGIESHSDVVGLFRAMLLGYRECLSNEGRWLFRATGTIHIFAISGLHVGIFAMFIVFVLRALRISRVYWILFLAPLLIAYTFATGARASAVRACIMAITCFLAPLLGRRTDLPCALAFAAFLILVVSPGQLSDIGFIYSFVVVSWLVVLYPRFDIVLSRLWKADPMRIQDEEVWVLVLRRVGRYTCSLAALSFAAWLASAPLTAYFFGRFVPVALLCNIAVIPLAFLIVLSGCLSLVLGSCVLFMADVFNHAALALVSLLVWLMELMTTVPFGSMNTSRPSLWAVLLWYVVLGMVARGMRQGERTGFGGMISGQND